ncbi:TCP-1 chaperonin subunit delta [Giardia muris]|uniref:T-complex protein 1 subunit delta n=1 Tax=Giardia muris TaxID=5742 RepID=A0A4Z1SNC3_GIAMU|nr:TCP-1 chaperonin subunit delta [Giardia muris]|eukprot:TNJ26355.1 TCP-1 chaperonin subunit delta [Giardia muris]
MSAPHDEGGEKRADVRTSNILAARGVLGLVRTSLGPRGLDKLVVTPKGASLVTNDGATIMRQLEARHPAARMLIELSQAQDVEAGDGTTSVVVLAGALLTNCLELFKLGLHPTVVSEAYQQACDEALKVVMDIARPVSLEDVEELQRICCTTLSSKMISAYSGTLAPLIVEAVLRVREGHDVDLRRIHVTKKVGAPVSESLLHHGLAFSRRPLEGSTYIKGVKVGLIRFCLSPPKTDMESNLVVSDDAAITRLLEQERRLTLKLCKRIEKTGCNLLLVQKSIMREAVSELARHFLRKLKIAVIDDIERDEVEFISAASGATPVASIDEFTRDALGEMDELRVVDGITYVAALPDKETGTRTLVCRGANQLLLEEAARSIHDGLCAVRCLVRKSFIVPGGAAVEVEVARRLYERSAQQPGAAQYAMRAFADALELVPLTLAENAGLPPIETLTELRRRHAAGCVTDGLDVVGGVGGGVCVREMFEAGVIQPALVPLSALALATETARMLLKIDDIVLGR